MFAKILHYRDRCIGCNACVEIAPQTWRISRKDGKAVLLGGADKKGIYQLEIHENDLAANLTAAEACPVKVIKINLK